MVQAIWTDEVCCRYITLTYRHRDPSQMSPSHPAHFHVEGQPLPASGWAKRVHVLGQYNLDSLEDLWLLFRDVASQWVGNLLEHIIVLSHASWFLSSWGRSKNRSPFRFEAKANEMSVKRLSKHQDYSTWLKTVWTTWSSRGWPTRYKNPTSSNARTIACATLSLSEISGDQNRLKSTTGSDMVVTSDE